MRSAFLILALLTPLYAQDTRAGAERPSVRVHGESQVSAEPDEAEMDIGIVAQGANMDLASNGNTERVNTVVENLRTLIRPANIKTVNFSINPNFRYPKEGAPVIQGYTASNTVRVTIDDLTLLRKVIDLATKAGATSVNRLNFTMRSESEKQVRARALGIAASQAEESAKALASALHLKLGRVMRIEEGQPLIVSPAPQIDIGKAQSSDMTPLSPGYIQVHANVNLTYELLTEKSREERR